ncbi:hypothetical protein BJX63DRAFT_430252 [Aspergillus granulosus]|uniref:Uncharacterized protein n=1 Tax=Aspergillus granulosus TaxID=176169 RepID=A0ABR4HM53_9EURO
MPRQAKRTKLKMLFSSGAVLHSSSSAISKSWKTLHGRSDTLAAVNPLCGAVEEIFEQWNIEKWLDSYRDGDINGWILGDLALSGYTCILFMLRKASTSRDLPASPTADHRQAMLFSDNDGTIPRSDLSMRTYRRILKLVHHMICVLKLPGPEAIALILGNYRAYIAYAHPASGLMHMHACDPMMPNYAVAAAEDLLLLRNVAGCIEGLAREVNEFFPLARAFKLVNDEIRNRVQGDFDVVEPLEEEHDLHR